MIARPAAELFKQYCGSCHNARPLGERPFSNYHVAMTHMRDQAYLTGKEYRQLMYFLRRMDNVGPPTPPVGPSPKRLVFSQPIPDLRGEAAPARPPAAPPPSRAGAVAAVGRGRRYKGRVIRNRRCRLSRRRSIEAYLGATGVTWREEQSRVLAGCGRHRSAPHHRPRAHGFAA